MLTTDRPRHRSTAVLLCVLGVLCVLCQLNAARAQQAPAVGDMISVPEPLTDSDGNQIATLNLFNLIVSGGFLMIPIGLMSIVVITLVFERLIAMRKQRVMPTSLVAGLAELAAVPGAMDPRQAFRLCQENPSATSEVIQAMLLKIGRPQSEVESAVTESSKREASRMYSNVRWLNLAAAVTPLIGLLGTVWGLIQAFFRTTQLGATQNKADFLAEGIYVALVTTLGGLAVAIPAAIFAHYFEGRIQNIFHRIDELVFNLSPQVERFEGRMRVSPQTLSGVDLEEIPRP
ncbi:MAG: MotA/TolQ/ExbB proton channel family protein, partial [Planctomycetales bacterium]|nr:MotA/TolQ/ExbB proton channel family protein [Planctomycetales bacterium]